jgi:hypothetical protein
MCKSPWLGRCLVLTQKDVCEDRWRIYFIGKVEKKGRKEGRKSNAQRVAWIEEGGRP